VRSVPIAERILLIVNRTAGVGHGRAIVDRLRAMLAELSGERATLQVEVVGNHPAARACANEFLMASDAPAVVIVGGGSGTLRAVIEGLCEGSAAGELPGRERVRVGALRMGSGNPLARQFGVPHDPEAGLRGIIENLRADRTAPCCVLRCEVGRANGGPEVHYAATMGGFGQFGRTPADLVRWHRLLPTPRAVAAGLLGIERLNNVEYVLAVLFRSASCTLLGSSATEVVEVRADDRKEVLPLLAGVAMNFPFKELPIDPGVRVEDEAVSLYLIPFTGRLSALRLVLTPQRLIRGALRIKVRRFERVEIRLIDRDAAEFFLDEDPMTFYGRLSLQVAGSLAFVPGPEYRFRSESGARA
jgi:Diacylglycerol kinase catalytic domain